METRAEGPASTPRPYRAWRSVLSGSAVRGPRRSTPFAASATTLGRAPKRLGWSLPPDRPCGLTGVVALTEPVEFHLERFAPQLMTNRRKTRFPSDVTFR